MKLVFRCSHRDAADHVDHPASVFRPLAITGPFLSRKSSVMKQFDESRLCELVEVTAVPAQRSPLADVSGVGAGEWYSTEHQIPNIFEVGGVRNGQD